MTATHELLKPLCVREQFLLISFIMRDLFGEFFPPPFPAGASGIIFIESGVGFMGAILGHIFMMPLVYQFMVWCEMYKCDGLFYSTG